MAFDNLTTYAVENDIAVDHQPMETWKVWASAIGFVTIINLSSVMGILFFPLMNKSYYKLIMRSMIGLAIGSLSGSSLFHLIPAAFGLDTIEQDENAPKFINLAMIVWLAAWLVMIIECGIKIGVKMRARSYSEHGSRSLSNSGRDEVKIPLDSAISTIPNGVAKTPNGHDENEVDVLPPHVTKSRENLPVYRSTLSLSRSLTQLGTNEDSHPNRIKTVAWIIIIGDSLHNFIDGVSIGTAFVKNFHTGAVISIAIICEEFPHELGDFAILINSGMSVKKALLFNFLSALTCYVGMALGVLLGEISWDRYIFAFAAGIFLYVALGDMVPEITSVVEEVSDISPYEALKVFLNHNVGILVGILILYLLALYQV